MRRKKILISSYACHPKLGSEHGVGWNWSIRLAKNYEIWVITREDNKVEIEEEVKRLNIKNIHFVYVELAKYLRFWKKGERGLYLYYLIWQILAFVKAQKIHREVTFDAVWHLTFGNIWLPSFMCFLNTKFIWGPIGGADKIPFTFWGEFSFKGKINEILRRIVLLLTKINPLFHYSCKKSAVILTRTKATKDFIPSRYRHKVIEMLETAIDDEHFYKVISNQVSKQYAKRELKLISVGRLVYLKGFSLAIKALKQLKEKAPWINWEYIIIGDGPEKRNFKKLVNKLGVEKEVSFRGKIPRCKVLEELTSADIFLMPSFKEGGSWALVEAMLYGLVPVVLDTGGTSLVVGEDCGIKIKIGTPEEIKKALAESIIKLFEYPEVRKKLSLRARERILHDFNWENKMNKINKILQAIL